jgi:hypothetical protein
VHPERQAAIIALLVVGALLVVAYPVAIGPVVLNPDQPGVPPNCPCMIGAHYSVIYESQIVGAVLLILGMVLVLRGTKGGGMV